MKSVFPFLKKKIDYNTRGILGLELIIEEQDI